MNPQSQSRMSTRLRNQRESQAALQNSNSQAPPKTNTSMDPIPDPLMVDRPTCICGEYFKYLDWIACDNPECDTEWFHKACVGVPEQDPPSWLCMKCVNNNLPSNDPFTTTFSQTNGNLNEIATNWIIENIQSNLSGLIQRETFREKYECFCKNNNIKALKSTLLGKLLKSLFPEIKVSRHRQTPCGPSNYCHSGISWKKEEENAPPEIPSFEKLLANLKSFRPTLRRCPKGARLPLASELSTVIKKCTTNNDINSWTELLSFPYVALAMPNKMDSDHRNLTTKVKENVVLWQQSKDNVLDFLSKIKQDPRGNVKKKSGNGNVGKKVELKISDGDIKGAIRLITSEDTLAQATEETFQSLLEKHPIHPPFSQDNFYEENNLPPITTTEEEVYKAIMSFPNGSAGGMDGLRPQILKDLIQKTNGDASTQLLKSLTKLCNLMLSGKVPAQVCPILYGASLTALKKKCGGIRPIAVGMTYRRLAGKIGCTNVMSKMSNYFSPIQLGFGIKNGAEAGAHAARQYYNFPHKNPKIFIKLDYNNAFNTTFRDKMLLQVKEKVPELYPFLMQCYLNPSQLFYGQHIISSQRGAQQGDPLGTLIFCLLIHPMAKSLTSELNLWYIDDATLGGDPEDVMKDLDNIVSLSADLGMSLNFSKCEISFLGPVTNKKDLMEKLSTLAPGIQEIEESNAQLLGAPLNENSIQTTFQKKIDDFTRLSSRLKSIPSHISYFLLRNSLAIPKLTYLLRTSPLWKQPQLLKEFDAALRATMEEITNCQLPDIAWSQSMLPIAQGGLGIRHTEKLSLPCFLSSSYAVSKLISKILPSNISTSGDPLLIEALDLWKIETQNNEIPDILQDLQKTWEIPYFNLAKQEILFTLDRKEDQARFHAASQKESGSWLNALPSSPLGTLLDNDSFRISIAIRLGIPMCHPYQCNCGKEVDHFGLHGLSCKFSRGRKSRHDSINDLIKRALISCDFPSIREPPGCSRSDGKRPDGLTLIPWTRGKSLIWDFTCGDTFAASYINQSCQRPGYVANLAEENKFKKYQDLMFNFIFIPIAIETSGFWGKQALHFIKTLGHKISAITGEPKSSAYLIQRISIAVQRGNAASVLGSIPSSSKLDEVFYLL
jgi:hypothetical protein